MNTVIVKYALYGLMFIFLIIFAYWLIKLFIEFKKRDFLSNFFDSFSKKYEVREIEQKAKLLYEGATKDEKFIEKVDGLIQKSRIKTLMPVLTSELLITATLIAASVLCFFSYIWLKLFIISVVVFVTTIFVVVVILELMAKITFDKIDTQQLSYTNVLKNLSISNSDIVTIFEKSISYAQMPLKGYVEQFVFECKKGIPLNKAFKTLEDKIENNRFKQLIKNLAIASKHDANYRKVLNEARIIFKHYYSEKERRKKAVASGRMGIVLIVAVGLLVFKLLEAFTGNIFNGLNKTPVGNLLLGYFLVVFIYTICKFVTLGKLNY